MGDGVENLGDSAGFFGFADLLEAEVGLAFRVDRSGSKRTVWISV